MIGESENKVNKNSENVKSMVKSALIGALYATATLLLFPISYGVLQFRISEALCVIPFIFPQSAWGLFAGCVIANILSPMGANILDIVFGSLATLIAAKWISKVKNKFVIPLILALVNGVIVGAVLAYMSSPENFWASFGLFGLQVAVEEMGVGYLIGLPFLLMLEKYKEKIHI